MKRTKASTAGALRGELADRRTRRWFGMAIFAGALAARLFFWQATPDAAWPGSALYKGDAPTWLAYADALRRGVDFEQGLPLRPPGMAYLVSALWDGTPTGVMRLKLIWCVLGALVALLVYAAAWRSFGLVVAVVSGLYVAFSSGLLVLSTSLNNETPYLVLLLGTFLLHEPLRARPRAGMLLAWSALHALATLVRVEHALLFVLLLGWLVWGWQRRAWRRALVSAAIAAAGFAAVLAPWHMHAWRAVSRFNAEGGELAGGERAALASAVIQTVHLLWTPEAEAKRAELPAFARDRSALFVAGTVAHRGGSVVRGEDFRILQEAFDAEPAPLPAHPFVALYGPLNFYLANNSWADGAFGRAPLEQPPPLASGADRYPAALIAGLPPRDLALVYPPHLQAVTAGYRLGWAWIRAHPGEALRLVGSKLRIFWAGAALGWTGFDLPLAGDGLRRPVDLAVPESDWAALWQVAVLLVCGLGVVAARGRCAALIPWILWLAAKGITTALFFGYARTGATVVPVVAVLVALAVERWVLGSMTNRRLALAAITVLGLGVGLEIVRCVLRPLPTLDGDPIAAGHPEPSDDHRSHRVTVR